VAIIVNNAAGLISTRDIEFAAHADGTYYDELSTNTGVRHPAGTFRMPLNNFEDVLDVANYYGNPIIKIIGDATVDNSNDYNGMIFIGESMSKSEITVSTNANVYQAEFYNCTLSGVLDGEAVVKDSKVSDLNYINGVLEKCLLDEGTITLGGSHEAVFLDCWCGSPDNYPTIDMGGSGQDLSIRNYSGAINIENLTGDNNVSITLIAGKVVLDNSITAGNIYVCGNGVVEDNSGGTAVVDTDDLLNPNVITEKVWDEPTADRQTPGTIGGDYYNMLLGFAWMQKIITNKKSLVKTGSVWQLIIYDNDDTTPILTKDLKDKDGNNITDLQAGVLAQELKST
jgi:hypothetical protein